MIRFTILTAFVIALSACGNIKQQKKDEAFAGGAFPNKPGQVYGKWTQTSGNETRNIYLNDAGQVGFEKVCTQNTPSVKVSAVLSGSVDTFSKVIRVEQNFRNQIEGCELSVSKGPMNYRYEGFDEMILNGETFTRGD